ncbi:divergent PAP2 family protein [candidate division WOR-3 bacterium]|nr:divergent PAP2 family protein [candidate division WOR-3 bacterium]
MRIPQNGISVVLITLFSGSLVQAIKVIIGVIQDFRKYKKFILGKNIKRINEPGGMPSSHSSSVITLSFLIGFWNGFSSLLFGTTLFFSLIVIYDAAGVRRSVGRQAQILNHIIDELNRIGHMKAGRMKELLGHTPLEVLIGSAIGFGIAWFFGRFLS